MDPPYDEDSGNPLLPNGTRLQPGQSSEASFHGQGPSIRQSGAEIYLLGWIDYADALDLTRRTAFCRQWQTGPSRFTFLNPSDPDYENAD